MSIHDALYTKVAATGAITGLIASPPRFYPEVAPTSATYPYVTFQRIGHEHLKHQRGIAGLCYASFQVDVWAQSSPSANEVSEAFRTAFQDHLLGTWGSVSIKRVFLQSERDLYESANNGGQLGTGGRYRVLQEWDIWYAES